MMGKTFFMQQASLSKTLATTSAQAICALFISFMVMTSASHAAGTYDAPAKTSAAKEHASMSVAKTALSNKDYTGALDALALVVADEPDNADAWNLTGFAYRKSGNYIDSKTAYQTALSINPDHKGALEYMGELYLTLGDLPKAEDLYRRLKNACSYICKERDILKKAIKRYKKDNS